MNIKFKKDFLKIGLLILIIFISFLNDQYYLKNNLNLPAWDQGYHLTNLFKTYNIFEEFNLFNENWWKELWTISETYRGPLTYILSATFLKFFGANYQNAYLSNHIYLIITIFSIYNLGIILKNKSTGLWASFLFLINPFIFDQRIDYLIDLSQLSLITFNFYLLTRYFLIKNHKLINSIFCGLSLGLLFLTKPTGIIFLIVPYLILVFNIFKKNTDYIKKFFSLFLIFSLFIFTIYPWLSLNWITILSSIINSWNWGINYQEGLEINSLEGNIFYLKKIYAFFEPFMIWSFVIILVINLTNKLKSFKNSIIELEGSTIKSKKFLWYLIMPLNILMICTLMSTKDTRFILPILPYLCLISSFYINIIRNKNWVKFYKLLLIFLLTANFYLHLSSKKITDNKIQNFPHQEIISSISNYSPSLSSVVAVIPDTKELNTFYLESEAALQNNGVSFRQVISNEKNYKKDLERFNWFLIKDNGNQGVMINNAKIKLLELIQSSKSFEVFNSFPLPDGSNAKVYKRKKDNISVKESKDNKNNLEFNINKIKNGFELKIKGKNQLLNDSYLLINIDQDGEKYELNIKLPEFKYISENKTILVEKNIKSNFTDKLKTSKKLSGNLITKNNKIINLENINYKNIELSEKKNSQILEINKLEEIERMGEFLRDGDYDSLFELVGLINQTDPEQNYLKDAELIFNERLKLKENNYKYLYKIAIAQILQRKSRDASITLEKLLKFDQKNSNLYLAKSIVEIYNFDSKKASIAIKKSKKYNENLDLRPTIETVNLISDILNFKFEAVINKFFI